MILVAATWTPPGGLASFVRAYVMGHNQPVTKAIAYPLEPKSIAYLRAGQFWAVPLSDGRFGCGRVLYVPSPSDPQPSLYLNTRIFLAGLMEWSGSEPPTAQAIAGCKLLEQGRVAGMCRARCCRLRLCGIGSREDQWW